MATAKVVYERLMAGSRPSLRNVARAWLVIWIETGAAPNDRQHLRRLAGCGASTVVDHLWNLFEAGMIALPAGAESLPNFHFWHKAKPGKSLDADELLRLLGEDLEPTKGKRRDNPIRCEGCGGVIPTRRPGDGVSCRLCLDLLEKPWMRSRLEYLGERASQGLPLFGVKPPWDVRKGKYDEGPTMFLSVLGDVAESEEECDEE